MNNPKIRFKQNNGEKFPDWSQVKIYTLGEFIRGKTYSRDQVTSDPNSTFIVRSSNLIDGWFVDCCRDKQLANVTVSDKELLRPGDVVICTANGSTSLVGKSSIYDGRYSGSISWGAFCSVFRSKQEAPLAKYFFRTPRYRKLITFMKQGGNGALGNLNVKEISNVSILFPCFDEQQKIASFFSTLDQKIELNEQKLEALEELKKGLLQKIFSQRIRFRSDDGHNYPAWNTVKLSEISQPLTYGLNSPAKSFDGEHKYLRITDIDERTNKYIQSTPVSPSSHPDKKYLLEEGDIVFARTGNSVGKTYIYQKADGQLYYAGFLIRARINTGTCPYFIFIQTLTETYKNWVRVTSQRSGQPGINAEEYGNYVLALPSLEEQSKIASLFIHFDKKIELILAKINSLKKLKQSFMQQMFV